MADLISRAYVLAEYDRQHQGPPGGARKIMAEAPAVDAVPVVFCKDCKHWWKVNELCTHQRHVHGTVCAHECKAMDYCSDGERRNSE